MAKIKKNKLVAPFVKWVGGKRQLITEISENLPKDIRSLKYYEPFIGGGAILFHLQPSIAVINDFNEELINVYKVIKNNLDELIADLKIHENNSDYFYKIRGIDRTEEFNELTDIQRASRVIYLNKTCYNGLYRVNRAGEFNAPYGRYKNPNIVNEPTLKAVNKYLNSSDITIRSGDYFDSLSDVDEKSFVYIDPPYHPISESSNFTGYVQGGWDINDQIRLRDTCNMLNERGVRFLLSNSSSQEIRELYDSYRITTVRANRAINSNGAARGEIDEVLIKNYD